MGQSEYFDHDPFELATELIKLAFSLKASPEERAAACDRIKQLPEHYLGSLFLSDEWQSLLAKMNGADTEEVSEQEPWSQAPYLGFLDEPSPSDAQRNHLPYLMYAQDIRRLISDDFRDCTPVPVKELRLPMSPAERILACTDAAPISNASTNEYARRLPWGLLNHGNALMPMLDMGPHADDLISEFWEQAIRRQAHLGVPYRIAKAISTLISERPSRQETFNDIAASIEAYVEREIFDFLSLDDLADRFFHLRIGVINRLRQLEVMDPNMLVAVEIFAIAYALRYAAYIDLTSCWQESGGDAQKASKLFRQLNEQGEPLFERAFRAALRRPTSVLMGQLSARDREALSVVRHTQERTGIVQGPGTCWLGNDL